MAFQDLVTAAQVYFPSLQVKYKDQSTFMKILGVLLFFNPDFMTSYITTIGDTVYFPSANFGTIHPITAPIVLMHELVHISDQNKVSKFVFGLSYLFPQILAPLLTVLFFFIHWYIALPIVLLFLAPIPAYFRMYWEKRAYIAALYVQQSLSKLKSFNPNLAAQVADDVAEFKTNDYYWMWPFSSIDTDFNEALALINAGQRPFEDPIFDTLDVLVTKV
jgi:hypothetical protein